jgi:hypothetical protein
MAYTIAAAIKAAESQVGYRESGVNQTKYNRWLGPIDGTTAYAWCASFQSWCADQGGGRANVDYPRTASCSAAVGWFRAHGRWSSTPHVGDWVLYGPGGGTHVELVVAVSSTLITTIGGNTSGSLNGEYFNGDGVYRKQVARSSSRIYGYGRPAYATEEDDMQPTDSVPVGKTYGPKLAHDHYQAQYLWVGAFAEARQARIAAEAGNAAIGELTKTIAAMAADRGQQVDADALVQRITAAIENVTVHLDVADAEDPS